MKQSILIAGRRVFGTRKPSKYNIPGWNERAKELNHAVRDAVFQWNIAGRPRDGQLAVAMRIAKSRFRRELAFLRQNDQQLRAQALLAKLREGKCKDFWKEIRSLNPKKDSLPLSVAGVTGEANIANVWGDHFREISNSVGTEVNREWVQIALDNVPDVNAIITVAEVSSIVRGLKNNKAVGNDGIPGEVYKFASHRLIAVLALFLSACLRVKELPKDLMHVVVIPLLKCKTKDPSDMNNYRPIAIATSISKVLEQVILGRLRTYLYTADSQFGFKEGHGTELAIFALKQTIEYYRDRDSPVFLCFLDAKKAFDRVNHWTLFKKLIERGAPLHIVKLLVFWYREQEFIVQWGGSTSAPYHCINGIRQGGQLSPLLYNVYTDDLNHFLSNVNIGCHVANRCVNHLSYADDMVLLAPSLSALQELLDICGNFAQPNDIVYNTTKTVCMLIRPKGPKYCLAIEIKLNGVTLSYVDEFQYLGHIITADCTDNKDIAKQTRRQNAVGNMLIRKFSFASKEVKIQLFKSYCYPIYCNALWKDLFHYSVRKLNVSYNDTFRRLMQVPRSTTASMVFAQNQCDHIKVLFRKAAYSLLTRVMNSSNVIISAICTGDALIRSSLSRR
jgi:hypothetical protein